MEKRKSAGPTGGQFPIEIPGDRSPGNRNPPIVPLVIPIGGGKTIGWLHPSAWNIPRDESDPPTECEDIPRVEGSGSPPVRDSIHR